MLRATLKSLLSRKVRLVLSGLAVVLGVMFVSGSFVLTDTMGKSVDQLFATAYAGEPIEQISTSLYPQAPPTATPNSVALSPDGRTLIVANADINAVAVVDVSNPARSFVDGFIPTGWYPTAAVFSKDGKQILISSGKGLLPSANPNNAGMERRMVGAVSLVATPDRVTLADYHRRVMSLSPYSDAIRLSDKRAAYAHDARGNAYSEIGEFDHALEDYTATIRLGPDDSSAYFNRGLGRIMKGEVQHKAGVDTGDARDKAAEDFGQSFKLNPKRWEAAERMARLYEVLGKIPEAIAAWEAVLKSKPDHPTAPQKLDELRAR